MRPPSPISPKQCKSLERLVRQTKNTADYKRVQCVWLRAAMDLPPDAIARALGLSVHTVRMVQSRYLRFGEEVLVGPGRGGRHRENLSVEEEDTLLRAFTTRAETGEVLVVSEVKAAYERRIGRKVPKSTVYRLLGVTIGAKSRRVHVTLRPIRRPKPASKKTPDACPTDNGGFCASGSSRPIDVPGRGAVWADEHSATLLGAARVPPDGTLSIGSGIHLCLCRRVPR
jgi:transposase